MRLFSAGRHLVYTAIGGNYDRLQNPLWRPNNVDFVAFVSGNLSSVGSRWQVLRVENSEVSHKQFNRKLKILGPDVEKNYSSIVYVDGSLQILRSLARNIGEFLSTGAALGVFRHFERSNPWQELDTCLSLGLISRNESLFEAERLASIGGRDAEFSLFDASVVFRNPKNASLPSLNREWHTLYLENPVRDQISLPIVVARNNREVAIFDHWRFSRRPVFLRYPHRHGGSKSNNFYFWLGGFFPRTFAFLIWISRATRQTFFAR